MKQFILFGLVLSFFSQAFATQAANEKPPVSTYMTDVIHFRLNKTDFEGFEKAKYRAEVYDFTSSEGVRFYCEGRDERQKNVCGVGHIKISPTGYLVMDEIANQYRQFDRIPAKRRIFLQENTAVNCRKADDSLECDIESYALTNEQHEATTFSLTFTEIANLRPVYTIDDRFELDTQAGKLVCVNTVANNMKNVKCHLGQIEIPWNFLSTNLISRCQNLDHPQLLADCERPGTGKGWSYQCEIKDLATKQGVCHFKSNNGLYAAVRIVLDTPGGPTLPSYAEMNKITTELLSQNKVLSYKRIFGERTYSQFCMQLDNLAAYQEFTKVKERYVIAESQHDKNQLWISFHKNCSPDLKELNPSSQPGYVD